MCTRWRGARARGLVASVALFVLLAAGVLWSGTGTGLKFLNALAMPTGPRPRARNWAKPAVAILPFVNQGDDSNRNSPTG